MIQEVLLLERCGLLLFNTGLSFLLSMRRTIDSDRVNNICYYKHTVLTSWPLILKGNCSVVTYWSVKDTLFLPPD